MQETRSSSRTGLVELLATWELTSLPGVPGLFHVMSRFRGRDELALLGRIADSPGIALVPGLRDEVRGVLTRAREPSSIEPQFRKQVSDVVEKTSDALASYADEQRETLQRDLLESAAYLPHTNRERVFQRLWTSSGSGPIGRLDQVQAIDEARKLLDASKEAAISDDAGASRDGAVAEDPAVVAEARKNLETAVEKSAQTLQRVSPPEQAKQLVESAVADARSTLAEPHAGAALLAEQTEILESFRSDLEADGFAGLAAPSRAGDDPEAGERHNVSTELRREIATVAETLEGTAVSLPTLQVVRFRTRLNEAEAAAHADDVAAMRRHLEQLDEDVQEMRRLAEQQQRFEEDRSAAETDRMAAEIDRLEQVARGGDAKRLAALRGQLGERKKRGAVAAALPSLAVQIANRERLDLAIRLRRASRCSEKAQGLMQAEMGDARKALAGEGLAEAHEASAALGRALKQAAPWRGPRGMIVVGVLAVVLFAAAIVAWRTMSSSNTTATFTLAQSDAVGSVTFALARGGEIVDERSLAPGESFNISLAPGRYEVFVNDRYTGRAVHLPGDAGSIDPIPVPE